MEQKIYKIIRYEDPYAKHGERYIAEFIKAEGIQSAKRIAEQMGYDPIYFDVYEIPKYVKVIKEGEWVEVPFLESTKEMLECELNRINKTLTSLVSVLNEM